MNSNRVRTVGQLFARVAPTTWHWRPVSGTQHATWELVQDGAPPSNVFALGEALSRQARLIAAFNPAVLLEVDVAEEHILDASERLELVAMVLERHLRRAYRLKHSEHYDDLNHLVREISAVLASLQESTQGSQRLLIAVEEVERQVLGNAG